MGSGQNKSAANTIVICETKALTPQTGEATKSATIVGPPARMNTKEIIETITKHRPANHFNLIVLGGGPAGIRAAEEAAGRGQYVCLIEPKQQITGAPTGAHSKCLREAAMEGAKSWSVVADVLDRCNSHAVLTMAECLQTFKVDVYRGLGSIVDNHTVRFTPIEEHAEPRILNCDVLIIATGSAANRFPPIDFNMPGVYDSDTIQGIDRIPESMVVQGAGVIGLEYAAIFASLGTRNITVVEAFDKVVPMLDVSLQQACLEELDKFGIKLHLKTPIKSLTEAEGSTRNMPMLRVDCGDLLGVLDCDCVLSATGRHGNTDGIGLEELVPMGLKVGRGKMIEADGDGRTAIKNVFAVGDVAGCNLATVAQAQAERAVRCCWGSGYVKKEVDRMKLVKPSAVWTIPEIAWAGITEEDAEKSGVTVGTATALYSQTVKGCITSKAGFLKLVFDLSTGRVLGVHLSGDHSSDLVNFGAAIINDGNTIFEVLQFVFPAVTYHELYKLAAMDAKMRFRMKANQSVHALVAWCRARECVRKNFPEDQDQEEVLKKTFSYYDSSNAGFLGPKELMRVMSNFGVNLSEQEATEMVSDADEDDCSSGQGLDLDYFLRTLRFGDDPSLIRVSTALARETRET
eukprot:TRINITY_DN20436_c0_g1_i1.p1 TRINITY_DN20436_c0_g1~~TRINITY_DN20436_c0_g1_i1.p1  ORF type:complete len:631 (+),score=92.12 TRINITY_DN20436_c0_g1_i1:136-2028(+)